jgi:hypothetical protein
MTCSHLTDGPDRSPTARRARLLAVGVAATATLTGCFGNDPDAPAPVDVDAVQTDAPVTEQSVVVTYAQPSTDGSSIEVNAFVEGLVEDGGTCTATAEPTDGPAATSPGSAAEAGPATTDCGSMSIPLPAGADGSWELTVSYVSGSTELTSPATEVELP